MLSNILEGLLRSARPVSATAGRRAEHKRTEAFPAKTAACGRCRSIVKIDFECSHSAGASYGLWSIGCSSRGTVAGINGERAQSRTRVLF